ncbi:MAG: diguanylate cyclase [Acidobacteriaceae bacterium]
MKNRTYHLVRTGAITATVLILVLCAGAVRFARQYVWANDWVNHTSDVIEEIRAERMLLTGTVPLSGSALEAKSATILAQLDRLARLTEDNSDQTKNTAEVRAIFADALSGKKTKVDGSDIAAANLILERMEQEEYRLLTDRIKVQSAATRSGTIAACGLCAALLLLGVATAVAARSEFYRRARAEQALVADKDELTRHTRNLALVSAGSELIQAAPDEEQVNAAVAQVLRDLLPDARGYFGIVSPSNDLVEVCGAWGEGTRTHPFPPSDCLALQLGKTIHRSQYPLQASCAHHRKSDGDSICTPIRSAAGYLGVLHVDTDGPISRRNADVMAVFAAHVALGLTNLRMREALRHQTVRDPLTALFNRRYFDEVLARELAGAARRGLPVSVLMLDVDHFKTLNDTYGHSAGDDALITFAEMIRTMFRETDVACRYGGEEFAIILPDAGVEDAYRRAESFRRAVEQRELSSNGKSVGRFTTSIGVATSTDFSHPAELVRAADAALYRAKRMGRNTTWLSGESASEIRELAGRPALAAMMG